MVKTSRFTISDPFGPLWTTLECWQAWHVWPFLFVLLVRFFGTPCNLTDVQVIPRFERLIVSNHFIWLDVTKYRELRSQLSYREMKTEFKGAYTSCNSFRIVSNSEWGVFQCWQLLCFILPSSYLQFGRRQVSWICIFSLNQHCCHKLIDFNHYLIFSSIMTCHTHNESLLGVPKTHFQNCHQLASNCQNHCHQKFGGNSGSSEKAFFGTHCMYPSSKSTSTGQRRGVVEEVEEEVSDWAGRVWGGTCRWGLSWLSSGWSPWNS